MGDEPFRVEALDRQVTVLRSAPIDDGFATVPGPPEPVATIRAQRTDVSDRERMAAAQQGGAVEVRFLVRSTPLTRGILLSDLIEHEGNRYEVTGTKEAPRFGRGVAREITAARVR